MVSLKNPVAPQDGQLDREHLTDMLFDAVSKPLLGLLVICREVNLPEIYPYIEISVLILL